MKFKSKILSAIVMGVTTIGMLMAGSQSYATQAADGEALTLTIKPIRSTGWSYMVNGKVIHKIYEANKTTGNEDRALYCVRGGPGFGSSDMSSSNGISSQVYNQYFDMKKDSIPDAYKSVLPKGEDYNSLVAVLENCYVPAPQNSSDNKKELATAFKKELLNKAGVTGNMSDEHI